MAILINGNGNQAIYAAQDADLIASICGGVTSIAQVGNEFAYDLLDANTIGVKDGVILTKEGRRIQLDIDNIDEFAIPNGQRGTTSYYIIGYKLVTDAESKQTAQTFVQLMENGTDTIPEDTFRGGADEVYVSLYRVTQDGLNIDTVDLLLPKLSNINEINADLTANSNRFYFDYQNGKYGYNTDPSRGAGTFSPFSSGITKIGTYSANTTIDVSQFGAQSVDEFIVVPKTLRLYNFPPRAISGYFAMGTGYVEPVLTLSNNNNTLNLTVPKARATENNDPGTYADLTCDLYYIGDKSEVTYEVQKTLKYTLNSYSVWKSFAFTGDTIEFDVMDGNTPYMKRVFTVSYLPNSESTHITVASTNNNVPFNVYYNNGTMYVSFNGTSTNTVKCYQVTNYPY